MTSVLFVCMGNICRSPMAEGAFRAVAKADGLLDKFQIDSAGTIGYHAGSAPDRRAQATAKKNGIDISDQRSRKVTDNDFAAFQHILVMDRENLSDLMERCPPEYSDRIRLFLTYAPDLLGEEMPDPYYGAENQFDVCFEAAVVAANALLADLKKQYF